MNEHSMPMTIHPGYSGRLALLLSTIHAGGCALVPLLPISGTVSFLLLSLLVGSLAHFWRRDLLRRGRWAVTKLHWDGAETWTLFSPEQPPQAAQLRGSSYLHPRVMILNFSTAGWIGRRVILLEDDVDPEQLRRLSARLNLRYRI
jgi:hypothetical protein